MSREITKIAITGGPCSGKTTGMCYLIEKLSDKGFKVFSTPEIATLLINSGFDPKGAPKKQFLNFERQIKSVQIAYEDAIENIAKYDSEPKAVIFLDRCLLDISPYVSKKEFKELGGNIVEFGDKRYKGAIHLVTAADGAEKHYTCENNKARTETIEQARELDIKTQHAFSGISHFAVIDNSTNFEMKMRRTFQAVCRVLGIPVPIERERKFLVRDFGLSEFPPYQVVNIEQVYLLSSNGETRIRKRGQNGDYCYFLTNKRETGEKGVRIETEDRITRLDYERELGHADLKRDLITKKRICFVWKYQYFELDVFKSPEKHKGLKLLEIEQTEENRDIDFPPFIDIEKEVTDDPEFYNANLALKE